VSLIWFEPGDGHNTDEPEDSPYSGCQCKPADDQYLMEVDEGQASLVHKACGKIPNWGDYQEFLIMNSAMAVPVTARWESDCDGQLWHGDHMCDCDHWVVLSPAATEPPKTLTEAEKNVAEARRAVHESLIPLPAWEADRVRHLIADLETAVEARFALRLTNAEAQKLSMENGACTNCGATPDRWCEHCASCPDGCYGGHPHSEPCPETP
jgi:hypothetical protein